MWITAKLLWQFWSSSITKRFDIILQTPEHPHSLPKVCVKPIDFSLFNGMQNYHSNIAYFKKVVIYIVYIHLFINMLPRTQKF